MDPFPPVPSARPVAPVPEIRRLPDPVSPAPVALAAVVAAALSWLSWIGFVAYPFRLLTTIVHELSHGLAALVTGGQFLRFVAFPDGSGLAYTAGGWRLLVIPAGYLGAALFGAVLIVVGRTAKGAKSALAVVGACLVLLTLRYSLPTVFSADALAGLLTLGSGLALGAAALWVALKAPPKVVVFAVYLVAFQAGLAAFSDLWTLIGLANPFGDGGGVATDARSMAEVAFLPAIVWAVLWGLAALVILGGAVWVAWSGRGRQGPALPAR